MPIYLREVMVISRTSRKTLSRRNRILNIAVHSDLEIEFERVCGTIGGS